MKIKKFKTEEEFKDFIESYNEKWRKVFPNQTLWDYKKLYEGSYPMTLVYEFDALGGSIKIIYVFTRSLGFFERIRYMLK